MTTSRNNQSAKFLSKKNLVAAIALSLSVSSQGAVKDFAEAPLFLQAGVQPNIMFGVDDSGSMGWNNVYNSDVLSAFSDIDNSLTDTDLDITPSYDDEDETLHTCPGINKMYFDPTQAYTPWAGVDSNGDAYADIDPTKAPSNPYFPTTSTVDLSAGSGGLHSAAGYYQWVDLDNDDEWDEWVDLNNNGTFDDWVDLNSNGQFDLGESEYECPVSIYDDDYRGSLSDDDSKTQLTEWFVDYNEMSADQQQNFANWYSYYRKRDYVAKKALSTLINDSIARMGLRTLHNNNSVYTAVKDIDDLTTPVNLTAESNKEDLMDNVFNIRPSGGTPLRRTLRDIGNYFAQSSGGPILAEDDGGKCQQNFAIMMTDGQWNGSAPSVGNADSDNNTTWDGGLYADRNSGVSNTLADVAMYYYERDLQPTMEDAVPIIENVDENDAQHLVTYTVAFGLSGTLDPDVEPDDPGFAGWPTPTSNAYTTIDDVRHAAYNGRGFFLEARDPQELINSLNAAIKDIQSRTGSASTVAVNSGSYSSLLQIFQAQFNSLTWDGSIKSYSLNSDGTINPTARDASIVPKWTQRVIVSWDGSDGIPFRWNDLSAAQQTEIGSEDILNYIRGEIDHEVDQAASLGFRKRTLSTNGSESALGDIVHSSPVYVGEPEFRYPDSLEDPSSTYTDFRIDPDGDAIEKKIQNHTIRRQPVLYVGANDGLLHAFDVDPDPANTNFGKEIFAFAPSEVFERYSSLIKPDYIHTYTVDGSPYVGDAFFNNEWNTVLVSGLNAGGQGIFALNVTDPNAFTSENTAKDAVLWEFTDDQDSDMGFTFGKPTIAKSHASGRWVAIFGNGYNSSYADSVPGSGTAVLYVVDLETGALIRKIDTGINALSTSNGLSSPTTVDIDGDYIADYVYAGDLEGNVWKFDISSTNTANWDVAHKSLGVNKPLFKACNDAACTYSQPITTKPQVTRNRGAEGGLLIYVATGSYIYDADLKDTGTQTVYGLWDRGSTHVEFTRDHLLEQIVIEEKSTSFAAGDVRNVSDNPIVWHGLTGLPVDSDSDGDIDTHLGWYMDLVNTEGGNTDGYGERVIYDIEIQRGFINFATLIPSDDPCSAGGEGWIMALKQNNGGRPDYDDPFFDVDGDGVVDENDLIKFDPSGNAVAVGGVKNPLLGASTGCVFITLANGDEVCVTSQQNTTIQTINTGGASALGRWMWKDLGQ